MTGRRGPLLLARTGAASIEFALTFTLVLVAVIGLFEVGFIFLAERGPQQGVNQTARWVAVNSTTATALPIFVNAATLALGSTNAAACTMTASAALTILD